MADAVQKSDLILICMSEKYKDSRCCRSGRHIRECNLHVVRLCNVKSIQNYSPVTDPTVEPYCILLPFTWRGVQRVNCKLSIDFFIMFITTYSLWFVLAKKYCNHLNYEHYRPGNMHMNTNRLQSLCSNLYKTKNCISNFEPFFFDRVYFMVIFLLSY